MNCNKCGQSLKEGTKFCKECGTPVKTCIPATPPTEGEFNVCPKCQDQVRINSRFCAKCGSLISIVYISPDSEKPPTTTTDQPVFKIALPPVAPPSLQTANSETLQSVQKPIGQTMAYKKKSSGMPGKNIVLIAASVFLLICAAVGITFLLKKDRKSESSVSKPVTPQASQTHAELGNSSGNAQDKRTPSSQGAKTEGSQFLGKWNGYHLSFKTVVDKTTGKAIGEAKVYEDKPSMMYNIEKSGSKFLIHASGNLNYEYICTYQNGKLVAESADPQRDFYKGCIPTLEVLPDGSFQFETGFGGWEKLKNVQNDPATVYIAGRTNANSTELMNEGDRPEDAGKPLSPSGRSLPATPAVVPTREQSDAEPTINRIEPEKPKITYQDVGSIVQISQDWGFAAVRLRNGVSSNPGDVVYVRDGSGLYVQCMVKKVSGSDISITPTGGINELNRILPGMSVTVMSD